MAEARISGPPRDAGRPQQRRRVAANGNRLVKQRRRRHGGALRIHRRQTRQHIHPQGVRLPRRRQLGQLAGCLITAQCHEPRDRRLP